VDDLRGVDVSRATVLICRTLKLPDVCCGCGSPTTRRVQVVSRAAATAGMTVTVPQCSACRRDSITIIKAFPSTGRIKLLAHQRFIEQLRQLNTTSCPMCGEPIPPLSPQCVNCGEQRGDW